MLASGEGSFALDELGEPFTLRVDNLPDGWGVKSIIVDGAEVIDSTVSLAPNQESQAEVVLTNRLTHVTGTATSEGQPIEAEIVVFAADSARWSYPSRFVRSATADDKGQFRISGLPPTERYLAVATDYLEDGEHYDPEFLERMRNYATPFTFEASTTQTLELKVLTR